MLVEMRNKRLYSTFTLSRVSPGVLVTWLVCKKKARGIMANTDKLISFPLNDKPDDSGDETESPGRRRLQRSGSFCEVDGGMKAGRLSVNLPKRAHSFRSCLKKTSTVELPPSE